MPNMRNIHRLRGIVPGVEYPGIGMYNVRLYLRDNVPNGFDLIPTSKYPIGTGTLYKPL